MAEFSITLDTATDIYTLHFGDLSLELPAGTTESDLDQARADWEVSAGIDTRPVPQQVSMRQARLALLGAGLLATAQAAIDALPGSAGEAARIEWEYAGSVSRNSPLINSIGAGLGLTASQIDDLFRVAAAIP